MCPFYLKFHVILTDAAVFQKTSWGSAARVTNVPKCLIGTDFFPCIGMSAILRSPAGMTAQGENFQGLK